MFDPDRFLEEFINDRKQKSTDSQESVARLVEARRRERRDVRSEGVFAGVLYTILAGLGFMVMQWLLEGYGYCPTPTLTWKDVSAAMTSREMEDRMVHLDTLIDLFERQRHERCRVLR